VSSPEPRDDAVAAAEGRIAGAGTPVSEIFALGEGGKLRHGV